MDPIFANEGWFVSHIFYRINRRDLAQVSQRDRLKSRQNLARVFESFRKLNHCQLFCYSIWGAKADMAVLLLDPEFNHLNQMETEILAAFPSGVLEAVYSFHSMSETSEYMLKDSDYDRTLRDKEGLSPDSLEYKQKMSAFRERMQAYMRERLYPRIPEHRVFCFYPMNKSRRSSENWYRLDFESRKKYMGGHAMTGRKFRETVRQLVTGSIGLDDWEWGVTLFSDDPFYFKKILYEMRFDEASARFGEFGPFYVGILLELDELFDRLKL
jgi:chlorite dismutase